MRGGENFGVNNVSYGNIIVALNTFKYYIKLKYKDSIDDAKSGIYYFVFDINNNNQLTSSFGLTNALIVNGNINNRSSKTFLDLSMGEDKQFSLSLKGNAYKSTNSDTLNATDGIPSELVIGIKKNEIPTFTLNLNSYKGIFSGKFNELGDKGLSIESLDEDIKLFNEAYGKIEKEPESREVAIQLASKIFRTIFQFSKELATNTTGKWNSFLAGFEKNVLLEEDPELNTLYQRALGSIQNIRTPKQPVEKPAKTTSAPATAPVPVPAKSAKPAKPAKPASAPVPEPWTFKQLLNYDYYNFDSLANRFYDSIKGNSENEQYKEFSKKAFSKLKDFLTENKFLTGSKVNDVGKVITILYQYILKQLIKSKGILNDDQLQQILNSLLTLTYNENSYFNGIKTSQLANVWKYNKEFKTQINKILESINGEEEGEGQDLKGENSTAVAAEDEEEPASQPVAVSEAVVHPSPPPLTATNYAEDSTIKGGGNNATVIIENNTDNLNISEFGEPIIYIKLSRNSGLNITGFGKDSNKIPVFGYLTVGKELLLKLLSMQTNNNVSFEAQAGTYESAKSYLAKYALNNPGITIMVATLLTNGITKAIIESGAPLARYFPHIKDIVTSICSNIFGDWVGPYLTMYMPSADRSKSPTLSETWSQIWPKQSGINPMGNLNETLPNSTGSILPNSTSSRLGGKIMKTKKNKKSKKSKKNTRKVIRRSTKKYFKNKKLK